jgi:plastocyanin
MRVIVGHVRRIGIVGIVGIVGIAGCNSRANEPTNRMNPPNLTNSTNSSGTRVSVKTQPGTFVWLEARFEHAFPSAEGAAYMDQQGQMFMPDTVLARTGQPMHFRSSEDVLHNVRVIRSDHKPIFNVATPPFGSYTHTFDEPGFYNVTCDIHTAMRATIYVASTPYVGTADERGVFTFDNVVPGPYKVAGFADGKPIEKTVDVAGTHIDVVLR